MKAYGVTEELRTLPYVVSHELSFTTKKRSLPRALCRGDFVVKTEAFMPFHAHDGVVQ